ncbi:MAG: polymer-forming cytoskeletal protein [Acidobacteriota bacterium]|nr:polymer-forming cytoskeletal protein [Acidobacteriota bacterium]
MMRLGTTRFVQASRLLVESDRVDVGDTYAFSGDTTIRGVVEGDLSVLTPELDIGGRVSGDLNVCARHVEIDGEVADDVRVFSESLRVGGRVAGDLLAFVGSFYLEPAGSALGGLLIYSADVSLEGDVAGPVRVYGAAVRLSGSFGADVWVECDELTLEPGVHIAGDLVYKARNTVAPPAGSVDGEIRQVEMTPEELAEEDGGNSFLAFSPAARVTFHVYLAFVALLGGLLLVLFFRPFVDGSLAHAGGATLLVSSFGVGLVCLLVALVLSLLCLIVLPLSLGLLSALGALIYFGSLLGKMIAGQMLLRPLLRGEGHPALALVVGVGAFFVVDFIPVAGELLWLFFTIAGMGAALHQLRCSMPAPQASSAPAE